MKGYFYESHGGAIKFYLFSYCEINEKLNLEYKGKFAEHNRKNRGLGKPETFDFLGFTFYCSRNRNGNSCIKVKTSREKFRQKLKQMKISEDGKNIEAAEELSKLLDLFNVYTSDVDPVRTVNDFIEISRDIRNGSMTRKYLPIDTHVIEISKLKMLLKQIPKVMSYSKRNNTIPYLPIHPISYRKKWQYDDEAYNFIFDFLYSFRLFSSDKELNKLVNNVRIIIANYYYEDELVNMIYKISPDSTKRRMQTPEIRRNLEQRFSNWKNLKPEKQEDISDNMER